ncbi:DUF5131 family protein [Geovibrio ferrireducens]|jgi:protein gp37|uniref:DUF5131 family protein n=1 Tax=Geovibrio ferrireducens TaxID=46201 RepID=UPI002245B8D0|nr:phage Gp37/Gp68 family protein [Geovibrio ferrireducens]
MATKIEWTETTWNPVTGCSKISDGCANCYAEKMARRLCLMGQEKYKNGFQLTLHRDILAEPIGWKKGRMVFVCSMSDLFHKDVPYEFTREVFSVMRIANQHIFQVLTKRSDRLAEFASLIKWPSNVWAGVTVENHRVINRIDDLKKVDAPVKFLSVEPLIGALGSINLNGIDWVIVGGESGHGARPMKKEWVDEIKEQCFKTNTPFFFKQWGGVDKKKAGRQLDSRTYDEMPLVFA